MLLSELARAIGAELLTPVQSAREVARVAAAASAGEDSLVFVEEDRGLAAACAARPVAILLAPSLAASAMHPASALLAHPQPRLAFARAAALLASPLRPTGVHPLALVEPTATLGADVSVDPYAVVGANARVGAGSRIGAGAVVGPGVRIGENCVVHPRAALYPGVVLGDRVIVHAGAVLGADGFGYVRDPATGAYTQFPQQGTLVIEDDVDIGANTTIDRGSLGETRIGRGTKIDNLVHLGHNVTIGADVVIAAQTGISGSSWVGPGAVIAGQVGIGDHAGVGPGVILGGQAGVLPHKELLGQGQLFWGTPAKPVKQFLRELARIARLGREK